MTRGDDRGGEGAARDDLVDELRSLPEGIRRMLLPTTDRRDLALRMTRLAAQMNHHVKRQQDQWVDLAVLARRMAPEDPEVARHSDWAVRKRVPRWHFQLLRDELRNRTFEAALGQAVHPEAIVLEIGTGSGILAMMAARAGAKHVYTCEMEGLLVEAARENVRRNGLADRVTVIGKRSTEVVVGSDLPRRADVLVSEIVDNHLLGEDLLSLVEDARRRLLAPAAVLLPRRVAAVGVLVGDGPWLSNHRAGCAEGLDLSAMNRWGSAEVEIAPNRALEETSCDPVELFAFDLAREATYPAESGTREMEITRAGRVTGFVHWLRLEFSPTVVLDNRPPRKSAWAPVLHLFPAPIHVRSGERLCVTVAHDRRHITVGPAPGQGGREEAGAPDARRADP